jgi:hypothetical protein
MSNFFTLTKELLIDIEPFILINSFVVIFLILSRENLI